MNTLAKKNPIIPTNIPLSPFGSRIATTRAKPITTTPTAEMARRTPDELLALLDDVLTAFSADR